MIVVKLIVATRRLLKNIFIPNVRHPQEDEDPTQWIQLMAHDMIFILANRTDNIAAMGPYPGTAIKPKPMETVSSEAFCETKPQKIQKPKISQHVTEKSKLRVGLSSISSEISQILSLVSA